MRDEILAYADHLRRMVRTVDPSRSLVVADRAALDAWNEQFRHYLARSRN